MLQKPFSNGFLCTCCWSVQSFWLPFYDLLLAELNAYGFSLPDLRLMQSYLSNRKQRTKLNSEHSSCEEILFGVPHGSILGSLLFDIFLCNLFFIKNDVDFASYADDNTPFFVGNDLLYNASNYKVLQKLFSNGLLTIK